MQNIKDILEREDAFKERDALLGISPEKYGGSIAHFKELSLENLQKLIDKGYVNLSMSQNFSPTIKEFYKFMQAYPFVTAHGYARDYDLDDVSIEGIEAHYKGKCENPLGFVVAFYNLCRHADDCDVDEECAYSWWD